MLGKKPHVYVVPFPVQSHINPMLELCKALASNHHLKITFIITTTKTKEFTTTNTSSIDFKYISDEIQEPQSNTADLFRRLKEVVSLNLIELIEQQEGSPKLVVYDSVFPWMLDIAHQHGMLGVPFFTQSCVVSSIYYLIKQGALKFPFEQDNLEVLMEFPFLSTLEIKDLPSLSDQTIVKLLGDQFSNLESADFVLFNTFNKLEDEVVQWMKGRWAIKTIGPTNLLVEKDHTIPDTINLFESNQESCTKWLDSRETSSVVYVSFGSLLSLEEKQMEEIAHGLMMSQCWFLWVVRASEVHKLPPTFTSEKGLIVNWCSQVEVLAHRSVSCFLTHGGWNSTLEGLSYGVPLIVMAHWVDQTTNGKYVEDIWRVGVRARGGESGVVCRDEVCRCVKEVGYGDKGKEVRVNSGKWKKLAEEAVGDGGSSFNNIQEIVSAIL